MIQFGPELCGLLAQCLVIILCGNISIALLAVQPADGNQSLLTGAPRYPESTTIASSEYRILNPDIELAVRFKLRQNK
jgi:hypothetical protein